MNQELFSERGSEELIDCVPSRGFKVTLDHPVAKLDDYFLRPGRTCLDHDVELSYEPQKSISTKGEILPL